MVAKDRSPQRADEDAGVFKDALALTPKGGVVRDYPIVPGIELTVR